MFVTKFLPVEFEGTLYNSEENIYYGILVRKMWYR
jgi:hypothetical protein